MTTSQDYVTYAKDIGLVAGAQIAVSLLQFARLPILTKWLGASLYGTWSLIWVTVVLITPLATLGLGLAMVRFLAAEGDVARIRERFLSVVFTVLAAGVFVSLILILCSDLLASSIMGDISSSHLVKLASFMILTQALSQIGVAFFRTFRQMKLYSLLLLAKAAAQLGLMVAFLLLGWELKGLIIAVLISDTLCLAVALSAALRQIGFQIPRFTELKSYLKYGLPLVPSSAILWIIHSSDRYMVGYFMEAKDVGIYAAAYALASIISLLLVPLQVVLLPAVSKSYDDGEIARTRTFLKYSLKYLMMLSIPSAFGLSILASPLLRILTTAEFTSGSVVIPFVASGLLFYGLYQVCLYVLYLAKKTQLELILLSIGAALNIGLNLLLVPYLGIMGAAVATLAAFFVLGMLTVLVSFRYFKFDLSLPFIVKSILASVIMALAIWLLNPISITWVIISILLGVFVYFAIMFALKGFDKKELALLKGLVSGSDSKGE
jgi:O-antigen/teichoic acid export membrane protein